MISAPVLNLRLTCVTSYIQDFKGAQRVLDGLSSSSESTLSAQLLSTLGRLLLESGNIPTAATYFLQSANRPDATIRSKYTDQALLSIAKGEWNKAGQCLEKVLDENPEDIVVSLYNLSQAVFQLDF